MFMWLYPCGHPLLVLTFWGVNWDTEISLYRVDMPLPLRIFTMPSWTPYVVISCSAVPNCPATVGLQPDVTNSCTIDACFAWHAAWSAVRPTWLVASLSIPGAPSSSSQDECDPFCAAMNRGDTPDSVCRLTSAPLLTRYACRRVSDYMQHSACNECKHQDEQTSRRAGPINV